MAQYPSWWQHISNTMQGWSLPVQYTGFNIQVLQRFRGLGGWLLSLTVVVAMLLWNWRLLLATSLGMFMMLLVYWLQEWWQAPWVDLRRFWNGSNRQLTLAVGSGGIATFITYMAVSVWLASQQPWLATGAILQGLGTLLCLILLIWQICILSYIREADQLEHLLALLADEDPLKRLLGVRRLTRLITQTDCLEHGIIAESLRLLLSREQETVIRDAVLDSLQTLDRV